MKRHNKFNLKYIARRNISLVIALVFVAVIYIAQNIPKDNQPIISVSNQNSITGAAIITDGDTIKINNTRIRFFGIDAPESKQTCSDSAGSSWDCGKASTAYLKGLIGSQTVTCIEKDVDRYGRIVAVCYVGNEDLNAKMVSSGLAIAYRTYSSDYISNEEEAERTNKGLWQGAFVEPWDYRRQN